MKRDEALSRVKIIMHEHSLSISDLGFIEEPHRSAAENKELEMLMRTQDDELDPCELDDVWPTCTDPDLEDMQDLVRRVVVATSLTARQEQAVLMHVIQNATYSDIASILGVSASYADRLIYNGMLSLKKTMAEITGLEISLMWPNR